VRPILDAFRQGANWEKSRLPIFQIWIVLSDCDGLQKTLVLNTAVIPWRRLQSESRLLLSLFFLNVLFLDKNL
jgi:hypothetical protein